MSHTSVRYQMTPRQMVLLDIPIDDPYGGPAYGRKEKSSGLGMVVGIVASVASMGMGAAAWAAAGGINAGLTAATLSAGAMMAGGAMSLIGTVTGNKKLSMIGGVLGLAGGLGSSLVNSAGSVAGAGETTLMEAATKSVSESFNSAWKSVVGEGAKTGVDAAATGATIETGANSSIVSQPTALDSLNSSSTTLAKAAGVPSAAPGVAGSDSVASIAADVSANTGSVADGNGLLASGTSSPATGISPNLPGANIQAPPPVTPPPPADKGIIGGLMDYAKTPAGGQVVGNLVSGMASGYGQAKQAEIQQSFLDWKKDLDNRAYANAQGVVALIDPNAPDAQQRIEYAKTKGIPVSTMSVNPNAVVQTPNLNKPQGV